MVSHGAQALGAQVSVVVAHRLSWIFLIQGLNLYLLHWQANSLSLSHQGSSEQLHFWNLWTVWCYKTKADKHNIFPSCLSSVPPPAEGRSSPTNTPVFPPSSFVLLSFVWFYIFFYTGQVLLSILSWCSACTFVSEGVFLMCPWREMYSTSTYSSAILFPLKFFKCGLESHILESSFFAETSALLSPAFLSLLQETFSGNGKSGNSSVACMALDISSFG